MRSRPLALLLIMMVRDAEYMNYMEGVAENLPRVLYVHGSGQEVINLDRMD